MAKIKWQNLKAANFTKTKVAKWTKAKYKLVNFERANYSKCWMFQSQNHVAYLFLRGWRNDDHYRGPGRRCLHHELIVLWLIEQLPLYIRVWYWRSKALLKFLYSSCHEMGYHTVKVLVPCRGRVGESGFEAWLDDITSEHFGIMWLSICAQIRESVRQAYSSKIRSSIVDKCLIMSRGKFFPWPRSARKISSIT